MIRHEDLIEKVKSYEPNVDRMALGEAYNFSMARHGTQRRASGAPYFSHPAEVAVILADLRLDVDSIITAYCTIPSKTELPNCRRLKTSLGQVWQS